jgi:DNA adenine methylase
MLASTEIKRPALRYYGGKWKLAPWIISHFPAHKNYVEPCGGAASVLLQKPRSSLETYNDLDGNVVNFFRVLRDRPDELIRKIRLTPWARAEYELSLQPCEDEVERARRFFVKQWMCLNGGTSESANRLNAWTFQKDADGRYVMPAQEKVFIQSELCNIAARFDCVQIDNRPAVDVILRFDNCDTLFYFDPPYVTQERSAKDHYAFEWTDTDHQTAAALLRSALGYVIVSGYACPLYTELYEAHGWTRYDKEAQTNSGGKRIESIWLSPRTVEAIRKPVQRVMSI